MTVGVSPRALQSADAIAARLDALAAEQPALAGAAGIYRAFLPLLSAAAVETPRPVVTPAAAAAAAAILTAGRPLLPALLAGNAGPEAPVPDLAAAGALAVRIAAALAGQGVAGAAELAAALEGGGLDLGPRFAALLRGEPAGADGAAGRAMTSIAPTEPGLRAPSSKRTHVDPGLAGLVADFSLRPQWEAWRGAWEPALANAVAAWGRGTCWLCGAVPALAELRGHEAAVYLRCGRCAAAWPYARLACIGCGSRAPADLGVLYPEGDHERLRVETCERCHTYIKEIATFEAIPAELLPVVDLGTLYLDQVAAEQGYHRRLM